MAVAEFFVMRKYRRKGIGAACAAQAFDLFPRRWEVRQLAANAAATAFWRRAIHRYSDGRFEEALLDDERWRGPVQSFTARAG
jgi:predicted acetyltransferase